MGNIQMKNSYLVLLMLCVSLSVSCTYKQRLLTTFVETAYTKGDSIILFRNLPFLWDEMYVFSGACSLDDINLEIPNYKKTRKGSFDTGLRIIFLNKNEIVFEEQWFHTESYKTYLLFPNLDKTFKSKPDSCIFNVTKKGNNYYLKEYIR